MVIQSANLYAGIPLNATASAALTSSVVAFVNGLGMKGSDVLGVVTLRQTGTSTPNAVVMGLIVSQNSILVGTLAPSAFNGFMFGGVASAYISGTAISGWW